VLDDALALARDRGTHYLEADLFRLKGEYLLLQASARPALEDVEQCFQQAREVARRQQAKSLELRAVLSLSQLWQRQGKRGEARRVLTACQSWFAEGFDTADLKTTQAFLETLS
jgi:predicted ATPase